MSTFFRVVVVLLVVAAAIGIGAGIYNAGVSEGIAEAARQAVASGEPVPQAYGYGYGPYWHGPFHGGFGFFGIIFWILGILLIIGLVRAAFGWGRWRGGPGGPGGPSGWGGGRERMEEFHRELHRRDRPEGEAAPGA
jgi:hypothetical protein